MKDFLCPNSSKDQKAAPNTIGGDADVDHSQIIGGMQSICWGNISPAPLGFGNPVTVYHRWYTPVVLTKYTRFAALTCRSLKLEVVLCALY